MARDQVSLPANVVNDRDLADIVRRILIYKADDGGPWEFAPNYFEYGDDAVANRSEINKFRTGNPGLKQRVSQLCWAWFRDGLLDLVRWNGNTFAFVTSPVGETIFRSEQDEFRFVSIDEELRIVLKSRCPGLDSVVLDLADEAVRCHRVGLHRASAVMLGAASEALLLRLFEALLPQRTALHLSSPPKGHYGAVEVLDWLADQFEQRGKAISQLLRGAGEPATFVFEMPRRIRMADALRVTRNNGGHPGGSPVSRDEARSFLAVFPTHAEAVHGTTEALLRLATRST